MRLALFDFDGTITNSDSFIGFLIFTHGYKKFLLNMLLNLHLLIMMKLKLIPNYRAKEAVFTTFYKGWNADALRKKGIWYAEKHLDVLVKDSAMKQIEEHKKNGDRIVIVSASFDIWMKRWCENNGLELLCTEAETSGGIITGRLGTKNCYGAEKVNRVKELLNLNEYSEIFAYGDSRGDKEMLSIAHKPFYRTFI